jgi:hypothetical protein
MSQKRQNSKRVAMVTKQVIETDVQLDHAQPSVDRSSNRTTTKPSATIYKQLDSQEFKARIEGSFPSVYMTNISIVQGAALSLLAYNTFSYVSNPSQFVDWIVFVPYSFISFLIVLVVSYEYNWFVGLFRWSPKFSDTFITFLLGFFEIGPMFFLTNPKYWWYANALFTFAGAIAYTNTYRNTKKPMFAIEKMFYKVKRTIGIDIILTLGMTAILVITGATHPSTLFSTPVTVDSWYVTSAIWTIVAPIIYALLLAAIILKDGRFVRGLHEDFGIEY